MTDTLNTANETAPETFDVSPHEATYAPEDDKIRIYAAFRLPRDQYETIKAAGFKWAPKQELFVAHWSLKAEDAALDLCGDIGDEDKPRAERAAERAERFEGYQDKREAEAIGFANRYDAGPSIHTAQSAARAERSARRHDRVAGRAVTQWDKAEYWNMRTRGVIRNALHLERPDVRQRRIKGLESDLAAADDNGKRNATALRWLDQVLTLGVDTPEGLALLQKIANGSYLSPCFTLAEYPRKEGQSTYEGPMGIGSALESGIVGAAKAESLLRDNLTTGLARHSRYANHLRHRLAYENQMLAEQGGTGATMEIVPGGFINGKQIVKVSKDRAGRISKVYLRVPEGADYWTRYACVLKAEKIDPAEYRAPTAEELDAFNGKKAAAKAAAPKSPALINPDAESAARLQALWNAEALAKHAARGVRAGNVPQVSEVWEMTQAQYSARSSSASQVAGTVYLTTDGTIARRSRTGEVPPLLCKIRRAGARGFGFQDADRVIVITDKKRAPLPAFVTASAPVAAAEPQTVNA